MYRFDQTSFYIIYQEIQKLARTAIMQFHDYLQNLRKDLDLKTSLKVSYKSYTFSTTIFYDMLQIRSKYQCQRVTLTSRIEHILSTLSIE